MLLTFFLFCGFIIEPAIHSHNLRAKKKMDNDIGDYQVFMLYMPKVEGVDNEERMWKHSPKSKAACQVRLLLLPIYVPLHNFFRNFFAKSFVVKNKTCTFASGIVLRLGWFPRHCG